MKMICKYCGKEFESPRKRVFCSKTCGTIDNHIKHGTAVNLNPEPYIKQCVICGKEFETRRKNVNVCCHECAIEREKHRKRPSGRHYKRTWDEYVKDTKRQAEERQAIKKIEHRFFIASHTIEKECEVCGTLFYCLDSESRKTCSDKCSKKYKNTRHGKDKRIPKSQIVDKDITIHKLYRRDKGKCWICGKMCDWNDWKKSPSGHIYPGDSYPCRDHVIPISRGGLHSWDNVRLACTKCNGDKSDRIYPYMPLDNEFAYSERKTSAKRTIQKTAGGKVVKIWNSTAEIEKSLGLSSKHIQNVCRGDGKSAYGFLWEYE